MATPTWKVPSAPSGGMDTPPSERFPRFTTFMSGLLPFSKKVLGAGESPLGKSLVQKSLFSPSDDDKADSTLVSQQKPRILFPAKIGNVSAPDTEAAQNLSTSKNEAALSENVSIVAQTAAVTSPVPSAADIYLGISEPRIPAQAFPCFEGGGVQLLQKNSNYGAEQVPVSRAVEGQISQSIKLESSSPGITAPQSAVSVEFSHVKTENGAFATDRSDMVHQSATTGFPCFEGGGVQLSQNRNSGAEKVPVSIVVDGQVTQSVKLEVVAPDTTAPQSAVSVDFSHVKTENGAFAYDRLDMVHQSATTGSIPSMLHEESSGGSEAGRSGALQYGTNLVRAKIEHILLSTCEDTLGQHEELRSGLEGGVGEDDKGWLKAKPELPDLKTHCDMDDEGNLDIIHPVKRSMKGRKSHQAEGRKDVQPEFTELKTQKVMDTEADIDRFGPKVISSVMRSFRGRKDDPMLAYTCHWCRQKSVREHVECCRCPIRFCGMCLFNRNGEDIKNEKEYGALWVCPKCRGGCGPGCDNCCNCGPCRRELNLEPTGRIIEPCRDSRFTNAHDYLVHQETGESADEIASRKVGRCWTNGGTSMPPFKDKVGDQDHLITLRIPSHSEVLQSILVSGTLDDMDIDPLSGKASNEVDVEVGAKRKATYFQVQKGQKVEKTELHDVGVSQESCIEPDVENTSSSDNSAQDTPLCTRPTGKIVEIEALKVCEDGNSKNPSTAASCDLAHDIDIQNSGLSRKRQKKDTHPGDKWSIPSDAQGDLYTQKLKEALAEPLDLKQMSELWDLATRRKPILRLRETRGRTMHVMTEEEGLSYLDHHPELGIILEESSSSLDKLNLLRGFFFWLQHSCMDGAYKPWVIASKDKGQGDDCVVTDGPDCEVLAVVLPLDEKKNVSCLVKPIGPVLIDLDDDDDVEEVLAPIVSLPTRRQAIKQSRVQKIKACINCSKEFTMEKKLQRALYESCGHIETCVSCVETLWKLDKHGCPKCGLHQAKKPRSITDFAHTEGQPDIDLL